jgi:hypothetical protein
LAPKKKKPKKKKKKKGKKETASSKSKLIFNGCKMSRWLRLPGFSTMLKQWFFVWIVQQLYRRKNQALRRLLLAEESYTDDLYSFLNLCFLTKSSLTLPR